MKYERLPDWCTVCGYLGHLFKECGDGLHPPKALVYKDLKAPWFRVLGRGPGGGRSHTRGRNSRGGRGRGCGSGRGRGLADHSSTEGGEEHDNVFQGLDVTMREANGNRKREVVADPKATIVQDALKGKSDKLMLLPPLEVPLSPSSKQYQKRNKPNTTPSDMIDGKNTTSTKNSDARTADPHVGSRRAQ